MKVYLPRTKQRREIDLKAGLLRNAVAIVRSKELFDVIVANKSL